MTNYEITKKLFDIARGIDEVFQARAITGDDDYKTETMSIISARDRISEIATELARDESVEQEQNKIDDDEARDSLEEDVNSTRNLN